MTQTKLEFTKEDVLILPDVIRAEVVDINIKSAKDVFGDKAQDPTQQMLEITYKGIEQNIEGSFHMGYYNPVPEKSKLGKFLKQYNNLQVGTQFKLVKKEDFLEPLI